MTDLMTLREVADYFRVTPKTVYRLVRRRAIPAVRVGRQWRFERSAIDGWLQQRSEAARARILVIDDEEMIQVLIKETLEDLGHTVVAIGNSREGLELAQERDFDLVFLDLKMPGLDGAEVFRRIKAVKPWLPVTIITGYPDSAIMSRALAQGPFGIMHKPFDESDIIIAANSFLSVGDSY
jgi:excisionase family DNA binding protein